MAKLKLHLFLILLFCFEIAQVSLMANSSMAHSPNSDVN